MLKRVILYLIILLIALPQGNGIIYAEDENKVKPGKYSLDNILAYDTNDHPTDFNSAKAQFENRHAYGRTGISMFSRVCTAEGKWGIKDELITDDSGRDKSYSMDDMISNEVYDAIWLSYPEQSTQIIKYMKENNIKLIVNREAELSKENYNNQTFFKKAGQNKGPISQSQCEEGDELIYYNNLDFWLKFEFTIPGPNCEDPVYAAANPEECPPLTCADPGYALANPVECPPPPLDCQDPAYAAANPIECKPIRDTTNLSSDKSYQRASPSSAVQQH